MSPKNFDLDDPQLTAYVLGELDAADHAAVEDWLTRSESGRQQVASLRKLTTNLFSALQAESAAAPRSPSLAPRVLAQADREAELAAKALTRSYHEKVGTAKSSRVIATLTAASIALVGGTFALHSGGRESASMLALNSDLKKVQTPLSDSLGAKDGLGEHRLAGGPTGGVAAPGEILGDAIRPNADRLLSESRQMVRDPVASPLPERESQVLEKSLPQDNLARPAGDQQPIVRNEGLAGNQPAALPDIMIQPPAPQPSAPVVDANIAQNAPQMPDSRYGSRVDDGMGRAKENAAGQPGGVAPAGAPNAGNLDGLLGNLRGDVVIETLPELDLLIIRGSEQNVQDAQEKIRQMEQNRNPAAPATMNPVTDGDRKLFVPGERGEFRVGNGQAGAAPNVPAMDALNPIVSTQPMDPAQNLANNGQANNGGQAAGAAARGGRGGGGRGRGAAAGGAGGRAGAGGGGAGGGGGFRGGGAAGGAGAANPGDPYVEAGRLHWFQDEAEALHGPIFGINPESTLSLDSRGAEAEALGRGVGGGGGRRGANPVDQERFRQLRELQENRPSPSAEAYAPIIENEFLKVSEKPFSTFGVDVDNASYSNVRRFLYSYQLPPPNAVRVEELINTFKYTVAEPKGEHPIAVAVEAAACPWEPKHQLVRISVKGKEIHVEDRPASSLVFLVDTSGSMKAANKLPLVQASLRLLVGQMEEKDRISIVTYNSDAGLLLDSTPASQREKILGAIDSLIASGSTNGEAGLKMAYEVATRHLSEEGVNRILVCTDGDFNVGISDDQGMFRMIEEKRKTGVFLTTLGYGMGNIKDSKLEGLANRGNGHYYYIDQLKEAQRVLVQQLTGTLFTIAKDVKLQVEFNPAQVSSYRLVGYENRMLATQDFNNDRVDAGDMGAGHTVTALYEIVPGNSAGADPSRYAPTAAAEAAIKPAGEHRDEMLFVKLRYKQPDSDVSKLLDVPLKPGELAASGDLKWASSVAMFGLLLRDSKHKGNASWESLLSLAREALPAQPDDQRIEFLDMVLRAQGLSRHSRGESRPQPVELAALTARERARCNGRYRDLLDKFAMPEDGRLYGEFYEFGHRRGSNYLQREGAPDGYWVYVYPNWYVWGGRE